MIFFVFQKKNSIRIWFLGIVFLEFFIYLSKVNEKEKKYKIE